VITIALIFAAITLSAHHPVLWACNPGHSPASPAPSNCERIRYTIAYRLPVPGVP